MTGHFDVHQAAIAAVGAAAVEDPRIRTSDKHLIGSIAAAFKHYMLRVDANEACLAVKAHYRGSSDPITAEAIVHAIRRTRLTEFREDQEVKRQKWDAVVASEIQEDWDAIRSHPCDCGAQPGEWCRNGMTGEPTNFPGHPSRIRRAYGAAS